MKPANRTVKKRRVKGRRTRGGWFPSKQSKTTRGSTTSKYRKKKRIVIG